MSADHLPQMFALASKLAEAIDHDGTVLGIAVVTRSAEGELVNHMMTGDPDHPVRTTIFAGCSHQLDQLADLDARLYIDVTPEEDLT